MMGHREAQERPGLGRRLCCIAIAGIMLAAVVGIAIDTVVPDVQGRDLVVTESIATGTVGSSAEVSSTTSQTGFVLLNDSSFSHESGWKMDFYELKEDVVRVERTPKESGIQLGLANVALFYYYEMNLNLRDYELVTLSLDVEVLRGPIEIHFGMDVFSFLSTPEYHGGGDGRTLDLSTGESAKIIVQLDMDALYGAWLPFWLVQSWVEISIYPVSSNWYEWGDTALDISVVLENVTVTATSNSPLSQLSVDIQNTEGFSIYESGVNLNWREWPAINLSSREAPARWGLLIPWRSNDTIYVAKGNYSGIAGLYSYNYANNTYSVSLEVAPNTSVMLGLRFEMVKFTLTISPDVPYLRLSIWSPDILYYDHQLEVAPPFPYTLFVPEQPGTLIITLSTPPRVENSHVSNRYSVSLDVTDPMHIDIQLRIPLFPFLGVMLSTGEVLLVILGLALLVGAALSLQKPNTTRHWGNVLKDPRFWPVFLVGVSAVVPWFVTSSTLENMAWSIGEPVLLFRGLYTPYALGLDRTSTSLAMPIANRYMLTEIPTRIVLFWLPLKWAIGYFGSPEKWKFNHSYTTCVLLPLIMGVLVYLFTPIPLTISTGFVLVLAAPILWGLEILIYHGVKKMKK